ncbi:transglycosylase domain-containing protein [Saccharopolyspora sp. NPDC050642]|uniref:transglycosylase domain-containing protein n=1 Tax=Saccharopolyspora sp. NPDC050642 TaxID=3157099 RepID=UPI0033C0ACDA
MPPPGQPMKWPGEEPPQEQTGAWTPSFDDDEDDSPLGKRLSGDSREPDNGGGRKLDLPTTYTQTPPNAGRQGPPPPPPGVQQGRQGPPPPPPGPGRPPQPPGEQPTQNIPQTPAGDRDSDRRRAGGAAAAGAAAGGIAGAAAGAGMAGAAGAAGAGAAGAGGAAGGAMGAAGAAAGAAGGPKGGAGGGGGVAPEPQLLTHQEQGNYNYYADDDYDDPYGGYDGNDRNGDDFDDRDSGDRDDRYRDDDFDAGPDDIPDPDEEMSAAQAKRSRLWQRVRRSCYVAAALAVLVPTAVFIYGYIVWEPPSEAAVMSKTRPIELKYADGSPMGRIEPDGSAEVVHDISEVSVAMQNATMAAEDASFRTNPGFDFNGIARSVYYLATGSGVGGGSTITQQFLKLDQDLKKDPTYVRKIKEVVLAFKLTNNQSKDNIMLAYMNTADYGRGANGITAAARAYFGKKPSELNPAEAAVLAGVVQTPYGKNSNDPGLNPEKAEKRWDYVVGQMAENGFITPAEKASMTMPQTLPRLEWKTNSRLTPEQDAIYKAILTELEPKGLSESELSRGGYVIKTTIDPDAQQKAEQAVQDVMGSQPKTLRTSLVAVDPQNGEIRAYYGSKQQNGDLDWASTPQEPGSSFKPFAVIAGLEKGKGIGEYYDGSGDQIIAGHKFDNSPGVHCDVPTHCGVREAMTNSVNTVFVNMAAQFGPTKVAEAAHQAGIPDSTKLQSPGGAVEAGIALGMYQVLPKDMAASYGSFVNGGNKVPAHFVKEAISPETGSFDLQIPEPEPAFGSATESKDIAYNVSQSMLKVAEHSKVPLAGNRPVVSKTGTHQWLSTTKNKNAWMIGAVPQISAAVAMQNDDGGPKPLADSSGESFYGGNWPAKVWKKFMDSYLQGKKVEEFPKGDTIGQFADVPPPPPPTSEPPPTTSQLPTAPQTQTSEPDEPTTSKERPGHCGWLDPNCDDNGGGGGDSGDGPPNVAPTRTRSYG